MKLQLNESTLNAYINEAIRQELNEGLFSKGTTAVRTIGHSPITKKFFGRIKDAKSARKFIMGLRRGKVVSGTVESGKGAKGLNWFTKDGKTFFKDAACKQQITDPAELRAVSGSFKGHYTAAANLFNSAQRNMLGTAAVAGLGTGWAVDHANNNSNSDDQQNEPEGGNGGQNDDNQGEGQGGGFPWDNTEPVFTPRPPRTTNPNPGGNTNTPEQEPAAPERPKLEPLAPMSQIQGQATASPETIQIKRPDPTLAQSAVRVMGQTANAGNMGLNDRRATNRRTRQNAVDAINQMRRDGAMTRDQARADKKFT